MKLSFNETFCIKDAERNVLLNHTHLADVSIQVVDNGGSSEYCIRLTFTDAGAELFAEATRNNLNKTLGIFVDDALVSNPIVQSEILDGEAIISGFSDYEQAVKLCDLIK